MARPSLVSLSVVLLASSLCVAQFNPPRLPTNIGFPIPNNFIPAGPVPLPPVRPGNFSNIVVRPGGGGPVEAADDLESKPAPGAPEPAPVPYVEQQLRIQASPQARPVGVSGGSGVSPGNFAAPLQASESEVARFAPVRNENGILSFQNEEHLQAVMENVRLRQARDYQNLKQDYINQRQRRSQNSVDSDFRNRIYSAYESLEKSLNFVSLRAKVADQERALLNIDSRNEPDNLGVEEPFLQAVLNQYGEIKVGGKYYRYVNRRTVGYNSVQELISSRNILPWDVRRELSPPVARRLLPTAVDCYENDSRSGSERTGSGKYRINWKITKGQFLILSWVYVSVSHWRRFWGIYFPAWDWGFVRATGYVSGDAFVNCRLESNTCQGSVDINPTGSCASWGWGFWVDHTIWVHGRKTSHGWLNGEFQGIAGLSHYENL